MKAEDLSSQFAAARPQLLPAQHGRGTGGAAMTARRQAQDEPHPDDGGGAADPEGRARAHWASLLAYPLLPAVVPTGVLGARSCTCARCYGTAVRRQEEREGHRREDQPAPRPKAVQRTLQGGKEDAAAEQRMAMERGSGRQRSR